MQVYYFSCLRALTFALNQTIMLTKMLPLPSCLPHPYAVVIVSTTQSAEISKSVPHLLYSTIQGWLKECIFTCRLIYMAKRSVTCSRVWEKYYLRFKVSDSHFCCLTTSPSLLALCQHKLFYGCTVKEVIRGWSDLK